jgi:hypothetical protein
VVLALALALALAQGLVSEMAPAVPYDHPFQRDTGLCCAMLLR